MTTISERPLISVATAPQPWSAHQQPTKFLFQRDMTSRDDQREIAVLVAPNDRSAKLELISFAVEKLNWLLRLEPNWDALGAMQVSETAALTAIRWLNLLAEDETFPPQIFPLHNGGVQMEWLAGGESLEIEIGSSNNVGLLGTDAAGNVLVEGDYPDTQGSSELIIAARKHLSALSGAVRAAGRSRT